MKRVYLIAHRERGGKERLWYYDKKKGWQRLGVLNLRYIILGALCGFVAGGPLVWLILWVLTE